MTTEIPEPVRRFMSTLPSSTLQRLAGTPVVRWCAVFTQHAGRRDLVGHAYPHGILRADMPPDATDAAHAFDADVWRRGLETVVEEVQSLARSMYARRRA